MQPPANEAGKVMGKKKAIRCSKCRIMCVEVGHDLFYPKSIDDPEALRKGKVGYEYRYVCPGCGAEYVYETLNRMISEVPGGADFHIRLVSGEEIIQVNSLPMLKFWGLSPDRRGIELRAEEVSALQRRARRIRNSLSSNQLDDEVFVWERFKLTPKEAKELLGRDI
jgi:hypothetical protein